MNHYEILKISTSASKADVKKAFKKLSQKHHPDKGGDPVFYSQIREAFRVLYNPFTRAIYDRGLGEGFNPTALQQVVESTVRELVKATCYTLLHATGTNFISLIKQSIRMKEMEKEGELNQAQRAHSLLEKELKKLQNNQESFIYKALMEEFTNLSSFIKGKKLELAALDIIKQDIKKFVIHQEPVDFPTNFLHGGWIKL